MQTPVEIDFQGMSGTPEVHASIEKHVAELEQRYGRVTACRVVLKGPGGHHRTGGLYEVNIRLALPNGREVNVGRTAQADERQAGLSFAISDAFKRAAGCRSCSPPAGTGEAARKSTNGDREEPRCFPRVRIPGGRRWSRSLFSSEQRARRRIQPSSGGYARRVRRGDGRERTAGKHSEAAREAQATSMSHSAAPPETS